MAGGHVKAKAESVDLEAATDVGTTATGATTVGKTGNTLTLNSTNHTVSSGGTVTLDAAGILKLNSSAGVISIGNDAVPKAINIGTGAAARTITIGNKTGTSSLLLKSGTNGITIDGGSDPSSEIDSKIILSNLPYSNTEVLGQLYLHDPGDDVYYVVWSPG